MLLLTKPAFLVAAGFVVTLIVVACFRTSAAKSAPYVPTPLPVVREMLDISEVGAGDVVYDLGSGDGRIPIAAVKDRGARRAVGIEVDYRLVRRARRDTEAAGVADRVAFVQGNFFAHDFGAATVLMVYMLPEITLRLRPRILETLRPGTRVVMHQFDMDDWRPDRIRKEGRHDIFLWIVPARVAGSWTWTRGGRDHRLTLTQRYQDVAGVLAMDGKESAIHAARLEGEQLSFEVPVVDGGVGGGVLRFAGTVADGRIHATFDGADVVAERTV